MKKLFIILLYLIYIGISLENSQEMITFLAIVGASN